MTVTELFQQRIEHGKTDDCLIRDPQNRFAKQQDYCDERKSGGNQDTRNRLPVVVRFSPSHALHGAGCDRAVSPPSGPPKNALKLSMTRLKG